MDVEPGTTPVDNLIAQLLERCTFVESAEPSSTHSASPARQVCALSGGPDSTALLILAVAAGLDVEAVHVDHGLRSTSGRDAELAVEIARAVGVPISVEQAKLSDGPNLEARARDARRRILGTQAMTGHTADDQAETLLLALIRGSGASGLAAMRPGPTKPILGLRRAETHTLCAQLGYEVAHDESNTDPRFRRNRIRSELLPLADEIAERDLVPVLTRTSALLRDDDALLDELAAALDPTDAKALAAAPVPLARRSLRQWLSVDGYPPDAASIERVLAVARCEASACDVSGGRRVERSQQRLSLGLRGT